MTYSYLPGRWPIRDGIDLDDPFIMGICRSRNYKSIVLKEAHTVLVGVKDGVIIIALNADVHHACYSPDQARSLAELLNGLADECDLAKANEHDKAVGFTD